MAIQAPTIDADLEAVKAALAGVQPRPGRVLLFDSRARGDARPDSDLDLLVVMPQATLTPQDRQQALRSLRSALRPLNLSVGVDLVVVGEEDAERLAGSRWHVVARALREGKELLEGFDAEVRQRLS
jgi:predicted nucleotidyltransferase